MDYGVHGGEDSENLEDEITKPNDRAIRHRIGLPGLVATCVKRLESCLYFFVH